MHAYNIHFPIYNWQNVIQNIAKSVYKYLVFVTGNQLQI